MKKAIIKKLNTLIKIFIYKQKQIEVSYLRTLANTSIHKSFYVDANTFFKCENGFKNIVIEEGVVARKNCTFYIYKEAALNIKKKVFINNYCSINCLGYIEIGDNTMLGEGVKLYDHNHQYNYTEERNLIIERDKFTIGKIIIGKNCWIASNVTILNNVEIGDNVIIGANCLIYKNVPSNSIVKMSNELIVTQNDVASK